MPFHIETWDKPDHQQHRQALRPAHLEFLAENAGLLIACGAKLNPDGTDAGGGIYIVELDEHEDAERFIRSDPFYKGELFERVKITKWRKAYAGGQCFLEAKA